MNSCQVILSASASAFAIAALAGCASVATSTPPASAVPGRALHRVHDPGTVTGTLAGPCWYRDAGQLPDPHCTPGAADPAVTQADIARTICTAGYTSAVRPPSSATSRFKYEIAYPAYGVSAGTRTELDHLVPLELGGANDASNLWPESPPDPNPKDRIEGRLREAVCSGQVTLAAAQKAVAGDWLTAEKVLGIAP